MVRLLYLSCVELAWLIARGAGGAALGPGGSWQPPLVQLQLSPAIPWLESSWAANYEAAASTATDGQK